MVHDHVPSTQSFDQNNTQLDNNYDSVHAMNAQCRPVIKIFLIIYLTSVLDYGTVKVWMTTIPVLD